MNRSVSRSAGALALAAALSMAATPTVAAEVYVPVILHSAVTSPADVQTANQHRNWGGWGGRRGRDDVSVGDVLTGVLIIGGIAAIASAASKNNRERTQDTYRYPEPDRRGDDARYDQPVPQAQWGGDRNIDRAVDACVHDVERGADGSSGRQVGTVDTVRRSGDGWIVEGKFRGSGVFSCSVGEDGQIRGQDRADNRTDGEVDDRPEWEG